MTSNSHTKADIDLASEVQQLLFPKGSPHCDWCCIGTKNRMARGLGGDYFDFIALPDGCLVVFLGDVTGHGLQASVVMALLYGFIHRGTAEKCNPGRWLHGSISFCFPSPGALVGWITFFHDPILRSH